MNPLFWLTNLVIAYTAYSLGRFITIRNLRIAANKLMEEMHQDNQTGTPIGASLAREMRIEL